jgi:hypothetical protein
VIENNMTWQNELAGKLTLNWQDTGSVTLDPSGKLAFPSVSQVGGLYCFRIHRTDGKPCLYIGESDNLNRRFGGYRNPGPTQETNKRINAFLKEVISNKGKVSVSIGSEAFLECAGDRRPADFSVKNVRRLFESFAISLENAEDIDHLNR